MPAKGLLMRVGIDQTFGHYNAPINPETNDYLYLPIPESRHSFKEGMQTSYAEIAPHFQKWATRNQYLAAFPEHLQSSNCHLDPDFNCLTYGDQGTGRGNRVRQLVRDDFLVFFASFNPIRPCSHKLVYALFGFMLVDKVIRVSAMPESHHSRNAHSRITEANPDHLVVLAQPAFSGRFEKAIPIGEFRSGAYRVRPDILDNWGGLGVKNGFIQRSVCPPWFDEAERFLVWLEAQQITFNHNNF